MAKCKKKDYEFDCVQWTGDNLDTVRGVLGGSPIQGPEEGYVGILAIEAPYGVRIVHVGDWITRDPAMRLDCFTDSQFEAMHQNPGN